MTTTLPLTFYPTSTGPTHFDPELSFYRLYRNQDNDMRHIRESLQLQPTDAEGIEKVKRETRANEMAYFVGIQPLCSIDYSKYLIEIPENTTDEKYKQIALCQLFRIRNCELKQSRIQRISPMDSPMVIPIDEWTKRNCESINEPQVYVFKKVLLYLLSKNKRVPESLINRAQSQLSGTRDSEWRSYIITQCLIRALYEVLLAYKTHDLEAREKKIKELAPALKYSKQEVNNLLVRGVAVKNQIPKEVEDLVRKFAGWEEKYKKEESEEPNTENSERVNAGWGQGGAVVRKKKEKPKHAPLRKQKSNTKKILKSHKKHGKFATKSR
jgi:hypothetical protein